MDDQSIKTLADQIAAKIRESEKEVLTAAEVARYMGVSLSYLYKLTSRGAIPYYKPMGKRCYFNLAEIKDWLQRARCATDIEITDRANRYCMKGGAR